MSTRKPLGHMGNPRAQTRPLSPTALRVLAGVAREPMPRQEVNPGVVDRLDREDLVEVVQMPSPYRTVKGTVGFLRITAAGRARLSRTPTG